MHPRGRQTQQRTYQAASYATNVAEHVKRHRVIAAKRYVTWVLEAAGLAPADARGTAGRLAAEIAAEGDRCPLFLARSSPLPAAPDSPDLTLPLYPLQTPRPPRKGPRPRGPARLRQTRRSPGRDHLRRPRSPGRADSVRGRVPLSRPPPRTLRARRPPRPPPPFRPRHPPSLRRPPLAAALGRSHRQPSPPLRRSLPLRPLRRWSPRRR